MTKMRKHPELLSKADVREMLESRIAAAGSVRSLALASGVSKDSISQARKENGLIFPAILDMLGLQKNDETYVRKAE